MMRRCLLALLLIGCTAGEKPSASATNANASFNADEAKWRATRKARLTSEDGWLSLVGLTWLHDGANEVSLPAHPPITKQFVLANGKVTVDGVLQRDDTDPQGPTVNRIGTLSYEVIKRGDKSGDRFGIRMRDPQSDARTHFLGLEYFAADPAYRVEAKFEPYDPPKKIAITNVLGMTSDEVSPGSLVFTLKGQTFRIDPILEQGEKDLFIIFKDATSGRETYGAARYVYAPPADASGKTVIDFNHAYNPPCAFTPYATCPLPPPQNRLPIRIEAGEKKYAGGHS